MIKWVHRVWFCYGTIHSLISLFVFISLPAACFVLAQQNKRESRHLCAL